MKIVFTHQEFDSFCKELKEHFYKEYRVVSNNTHTICIS